MSRYLVTVKLRNGLVHQAWMSTQELFGPSGATSGPLLLEAVVRQAVRDRWNITADDIETIGSVIHAAEGSAFAPAPAPREATPALRRTTRCRSLLAAVAGLLPADARTDALDEWLDELETATAEGRPIVRRTVSIVVRSAPRLAIRSHLRTRPRRERS